MNIFYLHKDPVKCAEMMHDKHVVKMILETAQLLCTAHRILDGEMYVGRTENTGRKVKRWKMNDEFMESKLYKATHVNHPSAIWARQSNNNYKWLYQHFVGLCQEYTYRYGKTHMCEDKLIIALAIPPKNIPINFLSEMPQAMPDEYKRVNPVDGYRAYYIGEKVQQSKWTKRSVPEWI
jgi:hypothetical protein